jgi:NhaA family Na+:H+ antiporter
VALGFLTPASAYYTGREYDRKARETLDLYGADDSTTPAREHVEHEALQLATIARESVSPLTRLEEALHPWSSFLVIPIFALANAGIVFADISVGDAITSSVALGVSLGLVAGKIVGITFFTWIAIRLGLGVFPRGTGWADIVGLSALAGVGFTVSLFITELAFENPLFTDQAKIGIFLGSFVAGVIGYTLLRIKPHRSAS